MLKAGANAIKITPETTQFLCGYPHVERYSKGVDTDLLSSALFLDDGSTQLLMIANDLLYFSKMAVRDMRKRIAAASSVKPENIMITSTHTHSGPVTVERVARGVECELPPSPDDEYVSWVMDRVVEGALKAVAAARPAKIGLEHADSSMVGCNRRDPQGPKNSTVPVLVVRGADDDAPIAVSLVVCVHPTVLHEDSPLVSADFPGHARNRIQEKLGDVPVVYHTGPAGNQSPRHLTRENTVAEAKRLGGMLGDDVLRAIDKINYLDDASLRAANENVDIPFNDFPTVDEAVKREREAREKLERMRAAGDDPKETRTAECDWFGTERRLTLARHFESGKLLEQARERLPAETQVFAIGPWAFVSWPGEIFVEFALELRAAFPNAYPIAYANGETQGYLVTAAAAAECGYEASTAIFKSPESPDMLVAAAKRLLEKVAV